MDKVLALQQEVEGSTPTGGTCPNDFSDPTDQDIRTQWALSWNIVVSEWRSVIAVSLNVGGGVRLIKPAKLYTCTQNTTNTTGTDARRRMCATMVPYRLSHLGNVVTRIGIHTQTHTPSREIKNATLFQWKIQGPLLKVFDRISEPSYFQETLTNLTKYCLE